MASLDTLTIGANKCINIQLSDADGNTQSPLDLEYIGIQVKQFARPYAEYVLGVDPELRIVDGSPDELQLEITKALSLTLNEGDLSLRLILDNTDTAFLVDHEQRCLPEILALEVIL
jgi:hypothetical protein